MTPRTEAGRALVGTRSLFGNEERRNAERTVALIEREAVEAYAARLREAVERDMPSEPNLRRRVLERIDREKP